MRILLISLPGWNVNSPHIALPILKSYLEREGHEVVIRDLNIEFYDYLLSKQFQMEADKLLTEILNSDLPNIEKIATASIYSKQTVKWVELAKEVRRSPAAIEDQSKLIWADQILNQALFVVSTLYPKVNITLKQIKYNFHIGKREEIEEYLNSGESDIFGLFYKKVFFETISSCRFDLIGVSLTINTQIIPSLSLLRHLPPEICENEPHICFGGNYLTRIVDRWGDRVNPLFGKVDSFIIGDGENAICELATALEKKMDLHMVSNLVYTDNNELIRNIRKEVNIDQAIFPDFSQLPLDLYLSPVKILPIFTTRGCPNRCAFCSIPNASGTYRIRNPENVFDEISKLYDKYSVSYYYFVDETLPLKTMKALSRLIKDNNLPIRWFGETRFSKGINDESCKLLKEGGCRKLQFGLESYNQRVLDLMKKNIQYEDIDPILNSCLKHDIAVHLFWMFGFPGETREELNNTTRYVNDFLKRSSNIYNNPYSTTAMGPFGLDIGSEVSLYPDKYGIIILGESGDYDLSIDLKYKVNSETIKTHQGVVQSLGRFDFLEGKKIFETVLGVSYHHFSIKENHDEVTFLGNCWRVDGKLFSSKKIQLEDTIHTCVLNENCSFLKLPVSLLRKGKKDIQEYYYLYNSKNRRLIQLTDVQVKLMDILMNKPRELLLSTKMSKEFSYLLTMDMINPNYLQISSVGSSLLCISPHIRFKQVEEEWIILDTSIGKIFKVKDNIKGYLDHIDNISKIEEVIGQIRKNDNDEGLELFLSNLFKYFIDLKVLYQSQKEVRVRPEFQYDRSDQNENR